MRRHHPCFRVGDVDAVVIEGAQCADRADHHRHRVGIPAEALEEALELLVDHAVVHDQIPEAGQFRGRRQLAVEQEIADIEEIGVRRKVFDRVTAVQEDACLAIDVRDRRIAAGGRHEARVVVDMKPGSYVR